MKQKILTSRPGSAIVEQTPEDVSTRSAEPFVRWLGGKRWLVRNYSSLFPDSFRKYFEPFLGGAAVYLSKLPKQAVLGDINRDLITTFQQIQSIPGRIEAELKMLHKIHNHKLYYSIRDKKDKLRITTASRFIYLNRTCFNGVYRVNKNGDFNVPLGTKTQVIFPDDNFRKISEQIQSAVFQVVDFEVLLDQASKDDFVFLDPPYVTSHNLNGFLKYNEKIFAWEDQIRLNSAMLRAKNRGVKMLLTNADHLSVRDLFCELGEICEVYRSSQVASNSIKRCITTEIAIRVNY